MYRETRRRVPEYELKQEAEEERGRKEQIQTETCERRKKKNKKQGRKMVEIGSGV